MVGQESNLAFVDEKIGKQIIEALNLRGLHVKELSVDMAPGKSVRATVELMLTRAQIVALLNAVTSQCRSVGAERDPRIWWAWDWGQGAELFIGKRAKGKAMLMDELHPVPVVELTPSVREALESTGLLKTT